MAWISVHEDVVEGPKLRKFYKTLGCSCGEALGILNFLWLFGLGNADKYGEILYADSDDLERYLTYKNAGSKLLASSIVSNLVQTGWIDIHPDGKMFIHDWDVWQDQWYKAKERRESDAKRKREYRSKSPQTMDEDSHSCALPNASALAPEADNSAEVKQIQIVDESSDQKATESPADDAKAKAYEKSFETFWSQYPRKIGKGDAYKKYKTRLKDGYSPDELYQAVVAYAAQCSKLRTESQYIKHPKTFLGDTLPFADFISAVQVPSSQTTIGENENPFADYDCECEDQNGL